MCCRLLLSVVFPSGAFLGNHKTSHDLNSRGGTNSTLVLLLVVLYALCHKKTEIILKKNVFFPCYRGSHYNFIDNYLCIGVFDSSHETSGCTDYNTKNLHSLQCTVAKKTQK